MTTDVVPILRVADAVQSIAWYRRLGFEQLFEHRFEPHLPTYVGIGREGAQIHLSEHVGDADPHGLVYLWVDDVDTVSVEFGVVVNDQPWGREIDLTDPDGNRLRLAEAGVANDAGHVTVDDATTATLFDLERSMWIDATRGDQSWMDEHLTAAFTEFGWSGRRYTRADIVDIEIGPIDAELRDMEIRALGPDAVLVTYRSVETRGIGNRASVWIRRGGRWCLDFHQGTPAI
ncbi:MAG TPA: glyoxalase superfamily protein [Ilumatobacteraceae bacterium]|nr:glyoxalase superfamily protein [Ilumatobacteraceae bacterium]